MATGQRDERQARRPAAALLLAAAALVAAESAAETAAGAVARCDALAASPFDAQRPAGVPGADFSAVDADAAVAACSEALRAGGLPEADLLRMAFNLGRAHQAGGNLGQARLRYLEAARGGHVTALVNASSLLHGSDDPEDRRLGETLLFEAVEAGHPIALHNLANRVLTEALEFSGPVAAQDALAMLERAAPDYPPSRRSLASWLADGGPAFGPDPEAAAEHWRILVAELADPVAATELLAAIDAGTVAPRDGDEPRALLIVMAEAGQLPAMDRLREAAMAAGAPEEALAWAYRVLDRIAGKHFTDPDWSPFLERSAALGAIEAVLRGAPPRDGGEMMRIWEDFGDRGVVTVSVPLACPEGVRDVTLHGWNWTRDDNTVVTQLAYLSFHHDCHAEGTVPALADYAIRAPSDEHFTRGLVQVLASMREGAAPAAADAEPAGPAATSAPPADDFEAAWRATVHAFLEKHETRLRPSDSGHLRSVTHAVGEPTYRLIIWESGSCEVRWRDRRDFSHAYRYAAFSYDCREQAPSIILHNFALGPAEEEVEIADPGEPLRWAAIERLATLDRLLDIAGQEHASPPARASGEALRDLRARMAASPATVIVDDAMTLIFFHDGDHRALTTSRPPGNMCVFMPAKEVIYLDTECNGTADFLQPTDSDPSAYARFVAVAAASFEVMLEDYERAIALMD